MIDEGFERVCHVEDVPEHLPRRVEVGGRGVLLCRHEGRIHGVDEVCPHKQRSMRFGILFDGDIICPHHQYHFDLETGRCNNRCEPVHVYEVRVVDGEVWVRP
jgi:nitrite reductase (NADH) small subunit